MVFIKVLLRSFQMCQQCYVHQDGCFRSFMLFRRQSKLAMPPFLDSIVPCSRRLNEVMGAGANSVPDLCGIWTLQA
jgi:hypothetical protein